MCVTPNIHPKRTSTILSGGSRLGPYIVGVSRADQVSLARALAREGKRVYLQSASHYSTLNRAEIVKGFKDGQKSV